MGNVRSLLLLGMMFSVCSMAYAGSKSISVTNELKSSPYKLVDRLGIDSKSVLIFPKSYTKMGVWTEDRYIFPGASAEFEVMIAGDKINDKPIDIIKLQLNSSITRILEFSQIQATPRLVLQFKVPAKELNKKDLSSIYIGVYIGKRLVDRLRLSADIGWTRKEYSLGNAQFLKQKLNLTLRVSCDSDDSNLLLFGYLKN